MSALEAKLAADTDEYNAAITAAATLTQTQMKAIARYVKLASDSQKDLAKTAKDASNSDSYEKLAEGAEKVRSAHAGVNRELLVLTHELSQGNFSRFGGSMLVLAERTNALEYAMTGAGSALLAAGAAAVGFAALIAKGAIENDKFNKSLIETNNYAGLTADSLAAMSHYTASATGGTVGNARGAIDALTASGRFGPEAIGPGSQAIVQMQRVTGQSAEEIVKDFERMGDGVAKWAAQHNESFHYLSATQYEYIKQLEDQGQVEQAEIENLKLLTAQFGKVNEGLGLYGKLWQSARQAASDYADQLASIGRPQTTGNQIDAIDKQLARMRQARDNPDNTLLNTRGDAPATANNIAALEEQRRTLQRQQASDQALASGKAQSDADQQAGIAAKRDIDDLLKKAKATSALTEALAKYHAQVQAAAKVGSPYLPADVKAGEAEVRKQFTPKPVGGAQASEYENLQASVKAFNQVTDEEISRVGKLTDAQTYSIHAHEELQKAGKKLSDQQRATIAAAIDEAAAHREVADSILRSQAAAIAAVQSATANQAAQQGLVESVIQSGNDQANAVLRQMNQIGKSAEQLAKDNELQKFDDMIGKALLGADGETVKRINEVAGVLRGNLSSAIDGAKTKQDQFNASFGNGFERARQDFLKTAQDEASQGKKVFDDAINGMTNSIVTFAETGKLSFKSLFQSLLDDIIRIETQKGLAALLGGGAGGGAGGSGALGLLGSAIGLLGGGTGATATLASALPGDPLDSFLALNNNFTGTPLATGLDYVPYDGYPAILHQGEAVLNATQAATHRNGSGPAINVVSNNSFGAGVDASTAAQLVRDGMNQTKAEIYRAVQTGKLGT